MMKGIDLQKALGILEARSKAEAEHHHHHHHHSHGEYGHENPKSCQHNAPVDAKQWGQTIELDDISLVKELGDKEALLMKQKETLERDRKQRQADLRTKMDGMSAKELMNLVLSTQIQRVATYRSYDRGLDEVLKTGNLTRYPAVCADATASFSVLSESINQARTLLQQKYHQSEIGALIGRLQDAEKNKLNFTAALHFEQIRTQSLLAVEKSKIDDRVTSISSMLQEDVLSLKQKISSSVDEINDTLEELRFASVNQED